VRIVRGETIAEDASRVLYRHGGASVVRAASASSADFTDVYAVNTYNYFAPPAVQDGTGELLAFDPGNFAVMRLTPLAAAEVAARLHGQGLGCGILVRLDGQPLATTMRSAPAPLITIDTPDERVTRLAGEIDSERIRATITEMSSRPTRYFASESGKGVAEWLAGKYRALANGRSDVSVTIYDHGATSPQPSLIVRIEGRTRPSEVIVLGSHIDSINMPWSFLLPDSAAPGADDNASGTATNLEIFRLLMEEGIALDRTLEIHGYAEEELGLIGSADIAQDYQTRGVNVLAMLQIDMDLYKEANAPDEIWFITDDTDADFNAQLAQLVTDYSGMPSDRGTLPQGSSDHASWSRYGYVAAFPFENPRGDNPHIHSADDTIANSGAFTLATGFAKLGLAYVLHFGGITP
jgi:leucyl aminopeptidase